MQPLKGFSLIELVIVFSVLGILFAISIPAFMDYLQDTKEQTLSAQLLQAMETARTESTTRKKPIKLCKSADQKTCSGDWLDGFIVMDNKDVIFSFHNEPMKGKLYSRLFPAGKDYLEFPPHSNFNQNGTFWFCPLKATNPVWAIIINQGGRARSAEKDKDERILDGEGKALSC